MKHEYTSLKSDLTLKRNIMNEFFSVLPLHGETCNISSSVQLIPLLFSIIPDGLSMESEGRLAISTYSEYFYYCTCSFHVSCTIQYSAGTGWTMKVLHCTERECINIDVSDLDTVWWTDMRWWNLRRSGEPSLNNIYALTNTNWLHPSEHRISSLQDTVSRLTVFNWIGMRGKGRNMSFFIL